MNRFVILIVITIFSIHHTVKAQSTASVSGRIIDSGTREKIAGATIELRTPSHSNKKYLLSDKDGYFSFSNLTDTIYYINVSFLGYESNDISFKPSGELTALGDITIRQLSTDIDAVGITGQAMRTSQRGDTLIYNASAFKVAQDADAEGLLSKMPGITVVDGEIEAQGERVKKVFVDGKEFFGDDVTTAIKNLPAEVIKNVEVYNKLSDQAEFTGVDDGEGYKALNFVTTISRGQFGKLYAGYGLTDKYIAGGNLNFFSGDSRISILGLSNNLNQQNFAMEDILGAVSPSSGMQSRSGGRMRASGAGNFMTRPQDGISKATSIGINFNDKWGRKFDVAASYFFNTTRNDNEKNTYRSYYSTGDIMREYSSLSNYWSRNYENRFTGRLDYRINENHTLMMRPTVTHQSFRSDNNSFGENYEARDNIFTLLNTLANSSYNDNKGYSLANNLIYRVKLGKKGRTLTLDAGGGISNSDRNAINSTERFIPSLRDSLFRERTITDNTSWRVNGRAVYTEPITESMQFTAQYRVNYSYSDADKKSYPWIAEADIFGSDFREEYSNIYHNRYLTQSVGPGINYNNKGNIFNASLYYQYSSLDGERDYPLPAQRTTKRFDNIVYHAMLNKSFNAANTLRVYARSQTSNPSINQLQDVVNMSNIQFVSSGNPNLRPSYVNFVYANYNRSNIDKGTTFMVNGGFNFHNNYIGDSILILGPGQTYILPNGKILTDGAQYTKPVNMSGRWSANAMMSYGMPANVFKSNVNISLSAMYSEAPSIINGERNKMAAQYYNAGLNLGSNISEKADFSLTYNGGYSVVNNSIRKESDNKYFTQGASFRFKWEIWNGITLTGNAMFSQFRGITDDFNEQYVICNLYVGKKIFRNRRGEISFGANDIFDQDRNFSRNVTDTYIERVTNSAIGRYFGFQFIYTLKNFGSPPQQSSPRPSAEGPPPSGRGSGQRMPY